jgi:Ala-tRNA(Pro) deacylase
MSSLSTYDHIVHVLSRGNARYRVMQHAPEGRCEAVSALRGNHLDRACKALVVRVKQAGQRRYLLLVLPADRQADLSRVSTGDVRLADRSDVERLTGCLPGCVPPFSFHDDLHMIVDPAMLSGEDLWFNAGCLDRSICLATEDFVRLMKPELRRISHGPTPT